MTRLSKDDVARLKARPETRGETAAKVAAAFVNDELDDSSREIAEEIFRHMVRDAEVRVRKALAESLKESRLVPHDVAFSLAMDVSEVAEPILIHSQVLTDADLIEIIETRPGPSRVAVARRTTVSATVSDALVETRDEDAVATLVGNPGAEVSEKTFGTILDAFPESEPVKRNMTHRPSLPVRVAERLVTMVSERLREHLVTHHELPPDVAADLVLQSREKAALDIVAGGMSQGDVDGLVDQLYVNGRLTPSIVLRALCVGDLMFFESAMARLAGVPVANVHQLIIDQGPLGLKELYRASGLPDEMFPAFRVATDVVREMDFDGGPDDRERFRSRAIERILTQFEDLDADNLDYLLARIGGKTAGAAASTAA